MFSRRSAAGPTFPDTAYAIATTVVPFTVHPADRSFFLFLREREMMRSSGVITLSSAKAASSSSEVTKSTISTTNNHCVRPLAVCRPLATADDSRLRARSSLHDFVHHVRGRVAPRRLVLRVLRVYVYIRERVSAFLGPVRTCI